MAAEKNKGGRPRKPRPYNYTFSLQVNEEEKAAIMYVAIRLNCSMSEVVRRAINTAFLYQMQVNDTANDISKDQFTDAYGVNQFNVLSEAWLIDSV